MASCSGSTQNEASTLMDTPHQVGAIGRGASGDRKRTFIRNARQHDPNNVRNRHAPSVEDFNGASRTFAEMRVCTSTR
jgi:hypothetical protein